MPEESSFMMCLVVGGTFYWQLEPSNVYESNCIFFSEFFAVLELELELELKLEAIVPLSSCTRPQADFFLL